MLGLVPASIAAQIGFRQLLPLKNVDFDDLSGAGCNFMVNGKLMLVTDFTQGGIRMRGLDKNPKSKGDLTYIEMPDGRSFNANSARDSLFYYYARGTGISAYWTFRFRSLTTKWKSEGEEWATSPATATVTYYASAKAKGQVMDIIPGTIGCGA
jgi:hypothetical protein